MLGRSVNNQQSAINRRWGVRGIAGGRFVTLLSVLALALGVLLVACGGDGEDDPAATSVPPTATADPLTTPTAVVFEHDPDPQLTEADVAATAEATGCPVSSYTQLDYDMPQMPGPVPAFAGNGLASIPDPWLGGRWYEGPNYVHWESEEDGDLEITAEPRDGASAPVTLAANVSKEDGGFTVLVLDDPGCWDVSASVRIWKLDFTIYVEPFEARSDMAPILADYESRIPWPVPADCAVTPIDDIGLSASSRAGQHLVYEVKGDGLSLAGELPLLFAGENDLRWYPDPWATLSVSGALAGGAVPVLVSSEIRSADQSGEYLATTLLFPSDGCYTLHAETEPTATDPARTLDVTVYVYPEACRTVPGDPIPVTCTEPQ
jgi:hypothetical protein